MEEHVLAMKEHVLAMEEHVLAMKEHVPACLQSSVFTPPSPKPEATAHESYSLATFSDEFREHPDIVMTRAVDAEFLDLFDQGESQGRPLVVILACLVTGHQGSGLDQGESWVHYGGRPHAGATGPLHVIEALFHVAA